MHVCAGDVTNSYDEKGVFGEEAIYVHQHATYGGGTITCTEEGEVSQIIAKSLAKHSQHSTACSCGC